MKSLSKCLFVCLLAGASAAAMAAGEDLVNCLQNGQPITPKICAAMRVWAARDAAEEASRAQMQAEAHDKLEKRQQEQAQIEAAAKQQFIEDTKRRNEEQAAKLAEANKAQAEQDAEEERLDAQRRAACGKDYGNPRIGMTLKRAEQCVGDFTLQGQINRADGVVTTYTSGRSFINVMNGRIVSWRR